MSNQGQSKPLIWVSMIVIVAIVGLIIWLNRDQSGVKDTLSAEDAVRLVRLAQEANACLENEQFREGYEEAEKRFLQLKQELPDSDFAYRNHVILRVLFFRQNKESLEGDEAFISETTEMIEELIERESDSFEPYILAVRWRYEVTNDLDQTDVELLEKAIENAGSNPVPYFEFFDKTSILFEEDFPDVPAKQRKYLAKAYELQPDNLKLATLYLQQLAEQKDERFASTWNEFKENLSPLVVSADLETYQTSHQEYADKIDAGVKSDQWDEILLAVRRLANLIKRGEVQKIDLARVQPHELELMRFSLDQEIVDKVTASSQSIDPVQVALAKVDTIPTPLNIRQLKILDWDLDDEVEIAVIAHKKFMIYERTKEGKWETDYELDLPKLYENFEAADLDIDKRTAALNKADNDDPNKISKNYSDPDFVFYGSQGVEVYENRLDAEGNRTLEPIKQGDLAQIKRATLTKLVDIDHDKDLDLVVACHDPEKEGSNCIKLFLSRGNLSFYDFSEHSSFDMPDTPIQSLDIVDIDRDIDIDILVGFAREGSGYLENLGHSRLRFRKFDDSFENIRYSSRIFAVEADGKPSWDLVGNEHGKLVIANTLTQASSFSQTASNTFEQGDGGISIQCLADFNNDGFIDCVCSAGVQGLVYLGNGSTFDSKPVEFDFGEVTTLDYDDLNNDGLLDLVFFDAATHEIVIQENQTETDNRWFEISVCGRDSNFAKGRINNHAIGSLVEVKAGDYYFATTVKRPRLHFGLGSNEKVDLFRFLWTSGMPQSLFQVESNQIVYEEMFEKGSCPYIYTWDGSKFVFYGDCLWAAPIGLQSAPGQFIPCRNWEYLKIPGEMLKPKEGKYIVQLTEELREAAYFDLVKLYAIDHPEDVDIFTNEKVGPPFIAEHKIHTVKSRNYPVAAQDMFGNDVLPQIKSKDGVYFKGFKERIAKGLAPMHYLELDFGDLKNPAEPGAAQPMTLFLNGWIRPTDCSLNISYSQNPDEPSPVSPVVLVPNEKGEWVKKIDPMGFPGGKPKTIAVDLTNAFLTNDYRIRIQTSQEIYWDEVFYTIGDQQGEFKQVELKLDSADLHYRGFSKRYAVNPTSPEVYDYEIVSQTPRWPAMTGKFTRYGSVKDLLTVKDDCSAVIGGGDEMTVTFDAIADPPPGWKRDFVIHFVGYDKDADLNTVFGQSSEPLPFDGMKLYPYELDEEFPSSEKHAEYIRRYQTRRQSWKRFWGEVTPTDSQ